MPGSARAIEGYLRQFSQNTSQLTTVGVIALVVSLLITLISVEATFNKIWRVKTARPKFSRFLVYWTVLTLGALVATASLALSTRFFALGIFKTVSGQWLEDVMLRLAPMMIEWIAFAAIYRVVPHRTVQWRHAIAGAALAVLLLEVREVGHRSVPRQLRRLREDLPEARLRADLPAVDLLRLDLDPARRLVRLLGVRIPLPAGLDAVADRPRDLRPAAHARPLRRWHRQQGKGLHSDEIQALEPMLTDALVQQMLAQLNEIGLVSRAESGEWLLSRDLDELTLAELYEACNLRIPITEALLPCRDDALGINAIRTLDELRIPLRELLKRSVSSLYDVPRELP